MEWECDRASDAGGEPSLTAMTLKSIDLLKGGQRRRGGWNRDNGYFLMVESRAHRSRAPRRQRPARAARHAGTRQGHRRRDPRRGPARHVDHRLGRPQPRVQHRRLSGPAAQRDAVSRRTVRRLQLRCARRQRHPRPGLRREHRQPLCGAEHRQQRDAVHGARLRQRSRIPGRARVSIPTTDTFVGLPGSTDFAGPNPTGFAHPNYRQEAAVPFTSETHSAEEVAIYAVGPGAELVRGTVKNTFIYRVMAKALGF